MGLTVQYTIWANISFFYNKLLYGLVYASFTVKYYMGAIAPRFKWLSWPPGQLVNQYFSPGLVLLGPHILTLHPVLICNCENLRAYLLGILVG